jgi:hypothetical protein
MENKEEKYQLLRLDDNNNVFIMKKDLNLKDAQDLRIEYENKGHKQTYFIERQD